MKNYKRFTVLYVEYDEDSGFMLSTLLGLSGIEVLLARSVREAFQTAQDRKFDLFLLDSFFPDGSGFELCRHLRAMSPQIPIVFYSGEAYENDRQNGLKAGADAYLVKPEINTVVSTVVRLMSRTAEKDGYLFSTAIPDSASQIEFQPPQIQSAIQSCV